MHDFSVMQSKTQIENGDLILRVITSGLLTRVKIYLSKGDYMVKDRMTIYLKTISSIFMLCILEEISNLLRKRVNDNCRQNS